MVASTTYFHPFDGPIGPGLWHFACPAIVHCRKCGSRAEYWANTREFSGYHRCAVCLHKEKIEHGKLRYHGAFPFGGWRRSVEFTGPRKPKQPPPAMFRGLQLWAVVSTRRGTVWALNRVHLSALTLICLAPEPAQNRKNWWVQNVPPFMKSSKSRGDMRRAFSKLWDVLPERSVPPPELEGIEFPNSFDELVAKGAEHLGKA